MSTSTALPAFFGGGQPQAPKQPNLNKELKEKTEALEQGEKKLSKTQNQLEKSLGALSNTKESLISNGEVVGFAMLSSGLEGYLGPDKLSYGGMDLRTVGGGATALYGVGQLLMGETKGMHFLNAGVGLLLPSLLLGARNAGQDLATRNAPAPTVTPLPNAPAPAVRGEEPMVRVPYDAMLPFPQVNQFGAEPYPSAHQNPWQRGVNVRCEVQPLPPQAPAGFNGQPNVAGYGYPAPGQGYVPYGPNQGVPAPGYGPAYAQNPGVAGQGYGPAYAQNPGVAGQGYGPAYAQNPGFAGQGYGPAYAQNPGFAGQGYPPGYAPAPAPMPPTGVTPDAPARGHQYAVSHEAPQPRREITLPAPQGAASPAPEPQVSGEDNQWVTFIPTSR